MPVEVDLRGRCPRRLKEWARRAACAALQAEGIESLRDVELSLWLTTDRIIQRLNRQHRRVDKPTDVLSFPQIQPTGQWVNGAMGQRVHLGDVVISLPTARRQALEQGWSLEEEIAWLTVHGVLHLLGYEDETEAAREKMLKRQEEILTMMRET